MIKFSWVIVVCLLCFVPGLDGMVAAVAAEQVVEQEDAFDPFEEVLSSDGVEEMAFTMEEPADPLETVNRAMFEFNDTLYHAVIKPVATAYDALIPSPIRERAESFFHHLAAPQYIVSSALQGDVGQAGVEVSRFVVNTVLGGAGLWDVASVMGLEGANEDIGQVLGHYGAGDGLYVVWPLVGPSNFRDTVGLVGDMLLSPMTYAVTEPWTRAATYGSQKVNEASMRLGEYEQFKKAALDPYVAMRNAYLQKRNTQIQE